MDETERLVETGLGLSLPTCSDPGPCERVLIMKLWLWYYLQSSLFQVVCVITCTCLDVTLESSIPVNFILVTLCWSLPPTRIESGLFIVTRLAARTGSPDAPAVGRFISILSSTGCRAHQIPAGDLAGISGINSTRLLRKFSMIRLEHCDRHRRLRSGPDNHNLHWSQFKRPNIIWSSSESL